MENLLLQLLLRFTSEVVPKSLNRSYQDIVDESSKDLSIMNSLFIQYNTSLANKGHITTEQSFQLGKKWYIGDHIPNDEARKMAVC